MYQTFLYQEHIQDTQAGYIYFFPILRFLMGFFLADKTRRLLSTAGKMSPRTYEWILRCTLLSRTEPLLLLLLCVVVCLSEFLYYLTSVVTQLYIPSTVVSHIQRNGCQPEKTTILTGRPGSSEVPRNPLTRWDVSSIPANGIFLTKKTNKLKNKK